MPTGVLVDSARPAAKLIFCEKENALRQESEGSPFYGKEMQPQFSSNCVLGAVTSVDREAGQGQDSSYGLGPWKQLADSAQLEDCLTVRRLAVDTGRNATQTPSARRPALRADKSLHIRLMGGDADLQIYTLSDEPAKHKSTPLPGRLFQRALSALDAGPGRRPSAAMEEGEEGTCSDCSSQVEPLSAAPSEQVAAAAPWAPDCGLPSEAPPQLLPIMVFDSRSTLRQRMMEWAAEIGTLNQMQAQIRLVSGSDFVPLCPRCPVTQVLLTQAGLFPQTVVSGAARFQELLEHLPHLQAPAASCGIWQFGQVAVLGADMRLQVVGYKPEAMSLAHANPQLVSCFIACAFHEANRQDSSPAHALHTITADGIFLVPRVPRYSLLDLGEWLAMAQGYHFSLGMAREAALLAAPACSVVEGAVIVV